MKYFLISVVFTIFMSCIDYLIRKICYRIIYKDVKDEEKRKRTHKVILYIFLVEIFCFEVLSLIILCIFKVHIEFQMIILYSILTTFVGLSFSSSIFKLLHSITSFFIIFDVLSNHLFI